VNAGHITNVRPSGEIAADCTFSWIRMGVPPAAGIRQIPAVLLT
jgi:hypothetical protein